ncbi:MAG: hypothetical protein ACR2RD_06340 [Woeseiaceae bacterium]
MRHILTLSLLMLILSTSACSSQPPAPIVQTVDDSSGESLTHSREPLRMVALRPALSRVGKDYLFVAPVSVSGRGTPQDYLWFAFGSTLDRRLAGTPIPAVKTIVLFVDEMPMTFDLAAWPELSSSQPFELDVEHYMSFGAKITASQLRRIASANALRAYVTDGANRSPTYELSDGSFVAWSAF